MEDFNVIAGICSIFGLLFSILAAFQAKRASKSASDARDAVLIRTLSDDLQLACTRGEQLLDFLKHSRYREADLRLEELVWSLSELPHRRNPHLSIDHKNKMLNSRLQLASIIEAIDLYAGNEKDIDRKHILYIARGVIKISHFEELKLRPLPFPMDR